MFLLSQQTKLVKRLHHEVVDQVVHSDSVPFVSSEEKVFPNDTYFFSERKFGPRKKFLLTLLPKIRVRKQHLKRNYLLPTSTFFRPYEEH